MLAASRFRQLTQAVLLAAAVAVLCVGASFGAEGDVCKFGMVGTPPNCDCPAGTNFQGYKGCLPVSCPEGAVVKGSGCVCSPGLVYVAAANACRAPEPKKCGGDRIGFEPNCTCPKGSKPSGADNCVKSAQKLVCKWRGTAPNCNGACKPDELDEGHGMSGAEGTTYVGGQFDFGARCETGVKKLCCHSE